MAACSTLTHGWVPRSILTPTRIRFVEMVWLLIRFSESPLLFTAALSGSSSISDYSTEQQTTETPRKTSSSLVFLCCLLIAGLTDVASKSCCFHLPWVYLPTSNLLVSVGIIIQSNQPLQKIKEDAVFALFCSFFLMNHMRRAMTGQSVASVNHPFKVGPLLTPSSAPFPHAVSLMGFSQKGPAEGAEV